MKNTAKYLVSLLAILAVSLSTQSCKKNSSEFTGTQDLYTCHILQHLTQSELAAKMVGNWRWTERTCESTGTMSADKNITVRFSADGTFQVSFNKAIITTGNWTLKVVDWDFYGLEMDNPSEYLAGRILICDSKLLFNNSYIDACDHLFERVP